MATKEITIVEIKKIIFAKAKALENLIEKEIKIIVNEKKSYHWRINTKTKINQRTIDRKS